MHSEPVLKRLQLATSTATVYGFNNSPQPGRQQPGHSSCCDGWITLSAYQNTGQFVIELVLNKPGKDSELFDDC